MRRKQRFQRGKLARYSLHHTQLPVAVRRKAMMQAAVSIQKLEFDEKILITSASMSKFRLILPSATFSGNAISSEEHPQINAGNKRNKSLFFFIYKTLTTKKIATK